MKGNASLFAYTFHQYSLSRGDSSYIPPSRLMTPSKCAGKARGLKDATKESKFTSALPWLVV